MKRCTKCGETKPLEGFGRDKSRKDGLLFYCKTCVNSRIRLYRAENPHTTKQHLRKQYEKEKYTRQEYRKLHYSINRARILRVNSIWRAKNYEVYARCRHTATVVRRARKQTVDAEPVSLLDLIQRDGATCYLCHCTVDPRAPARAANKAEMEHVIPLSRGGTHTWDNLKVACSPCNRLKGARLTADETRALVLEKMLG